MARFGLAVVAFFGVMNHRWSAVFVAADAPDRIAHVTSCLVFRGLCGYPGSQLLDAIPQ